MTMRIIVLLTLLFTCSAWVPSPSSLSTSNHARLSVAPSVTPGLASSNEGSRSPTTQLHLINPMLAGSIAGAVGVGVAFPLDTIKTKQQTSFVDRTDIEFSPDGRMIYKAETFQPSLLDSMQMIFQSQGLGGFFGGVRTSMMGQGVIKSFAFAVNSAALAALTQADIGMDQHTALLLAAATAGFFTAFLATPIDRIKVLMQCQDEDCTCSDLDCLREVIDHEGVGGLLFRGLIPTMMREVPAYTIYFSTYGYLMSHLAHFPGCSLTFGAISGGLCVLPTYPADVIKTLIQNSDGSDEVDTWKMVKDLYDNQGIAGFWDGLTPRVLRAAVNHAVTFASYDTLLNLP